MKLTAQVTIEFKTDAELDAIKARLPAGVTPLIDLLLKRVSFTIVQEIEEL